MRTPLGQAEDWVFRTREPKGMMFPPRTKTIVVIEKSWFAARAKAAIALRVSREDLILHKSPFST